VSFAPPRRLDNVDIDLLHRHHRLVWHIEGGTDARSALVKFQLRPDLLAK
jgi:hypothetical protein